MVQTAVSTLNRRRLGLEPEDAQRDRSFCRDTGADRRLCVIERAHVPSGLAGEWTTARMPGILDGARLVWTPIGDWHPAHLLTAERISWPALDAAFGPEMSRLLTPVQTESGDVIATVYAARDATRTRLLMLDGMNVHDDE